jgi:hypothetical protein
MKKILSNELHQIFEVERTNGLATAILLDLVIGLFTLSLWSDEISICILQGSDCIKPFIAMQLCMSSHPAAFTQYTGDEQMHERTDQESSKDDTDGHEFLSNTPPEEAIRTPRS